ncbi:hypothetical protein [Xanthocytophaga agilis]|uniref:Uncharacterized protein n=1 Tax=Xanthocytophaga agilis TaxID=3048010 RepID=A0AAE3RBB0_9BACT|nr:hypothetical protein [Xanthocytophaga agilis]MDJ1505032.1 hypothetical protein [Xanthocytophaga agilis]
MLKKLIKITNSRNFVENGHLFIKEVVAKEESIKIGFEIHDTYSLTTILRYEGEIFCEGWGVDAKDLHTYKRPYNQINLYTNHPLLWNYANSLIIKLERQSANVSELLGDLFIAHDKACGNWVDFHWIANSIPEYLNTKGASISVPEPLLDIYITIIEKHNLLYSIEEGHQNRNENDRVLIFGNPVISPDDYNFGQPYVVAQSFTETIIERNIPLPGTDED